MKELYKDNIVTLVEDNDRRIAEYLENGWKMRESSPKPYDKASKNMAKAIKDVGNDAIHKEKNKSKNNNDKKINDAICAAVAASVESEEVDDGLFAQGGKI